jgi:hypothetical protein
MRPFRGAIPLLALFLFCAKFAAAQANLDVHAGASTALDSSSGQLIDTFGDGTLYGTPKLRGTHMNFGATVMFTQHFGFGGEFAFHPAKSDYAGLQYRPIFYDFNAIWQPTQRSKRVVPELQAGIGGVNLRYYYSQQACDAFTGCSNYSSYVAGSKHFQGHFGAGVRLYVTGHLYVKPQVDLHLVNNFFQFGSNLMPQYGVSVGYTFGER